LRGASRPTRAPRQSEKHQSQSRSQSKSRSPSSLKSGFAHLCSERLFTNSCEQLLWQRCHCEGCRGWRERRGNPRVQNHRLTCHVIVEKRQRKQSRITEIASQSNQFAMTTYFPSTSTLRYLNSPMRPLSQSPHLISWLLTPEILMSGLIYTQLMYLGPFQRQVVHEARLSEDECDDGMCRWTHRPRCPRGPRNRQHPPPSPGCS